MKTIDVQGLPEPVVRALQMAVDGLRKEFGPCEAEPKRKKQGSKELPMWKGSAPPLEMMRREEIYRNAS